MNRTDSEGFGVRRFAALFGAKQGRMIEIFRGSPSLVPKAAQSAALQDAGALPLLTAGLAPLLLTLGARGRTAGSLRAGS